MAGTGLRKILWPIDPYGDQNRVQRVLDALKYLVENIGADVQPVYIVSSTSRFVSEEFSRDWYESELPAAREVTRTMFRGISQDHLLPPRLIQRTAAFPNQITDALLKAAAESSAELIVVDTHGRTGITRLVRGSFAERLALRSKLPLLTLGPGTVAAPGFKRILYCTHLDRLSRHVLRSLIGLAAIFHSDLTIYHRRPKPDSVAPHDLRRERRSLRRLETWARFIRDQGLGVEQVIEFHDSPPITQRILEVAHERRIGLIALEPRSGPIRSMLKGSTVRSLIRRAPCPVWIHRVNGRKFGGPGVSAEVKGAA